MEPIVDISFTLTCQTALPADHGYLLYAALSRLLPELHQANGIAVHPIGGRLIGPRQLQLTPGSTLTIRMEAQRIPLILALAGTQLRVGDAPLRVGVPTIHNLIPAPTLRSRLVTTKNGQDPEHFRGELRRQLDLLHVSPEVFVSLPMIEQLNPPQRRTIRIKDKEIVGHEVILQGLSANESLDIQMHGLGGRRHMGCGVFVPLTPTVLA